MKRFTIAHLTLITICLVVFCAACSYNTPEIRAFAITQKQLDDATILALRQDTSILGDPFHAFSTDTFTTKHKLRDLFENISADETIAVGTIMVRRAYYYPWLHHERDSLINTVVMVKREAGFYPEGGDWEYLDIKYNENTNYLVHPNGMLIESSDNIIRGKITKCANCHAGAGSKFVFHRDK